MEWFKFRTCWRRPLLKLTDEEAGRVVKALVTFIDTGEEQEAGFREDILLSEMMDILQADLEQIRLKEIKNETIREKKRAAGRKGADARWGAQQAPTADSRCGVLPSGACGRHDEPSGTMDCHDLPSDAMDCHDLPCKNKKKNKNSEKEKEKDTEKEGEEEKEYGSVPLPAEVTELPAAEIPLNDGSEFGIYRKDIEEYALLYPAVDIEQELRKMRGWCLANPTRKKTRRGVRSFINTWLSREQDKGGQRNEPPENPFLAYARGEKKIGGLML